MYENEIFSGRRHVAQCNVTCCTMGEDLLCSEGDTNGGAVSTALWCCEFEGLLIIYLELCRNTLKFLRAFRRESCLRWCNFYSIPMIDLTSNVTLLNALESLRILRMTFTLRCIKRSCVTSRLWNVPRVTVWKLCGHLLTTLCGQISADRNYRARIKLWTTRVPWERLDYVSMFKRIVVLRMLV